MAADPQPLHLALAAELAGLGAREVLGGLSAVSGLPRLPLEALFVEPHASLDGAEPRPVLGLLAEVSARHPVVAVVGEPGQGKTATARTWAAALARAHLDGSGERLPIYVDGAVDLHGGELDAALRRVLARHASTAEDPGLRLPERGAFVLVDGLDEAGLGEDAIQELLRAMRRLGGPHRFVVFARPASLPRDPEVPRVRLRELSHLTADKQPGAQVGAWLERWNALNPDRPPLLPRDLARAQVLELATHPLLLLLVALTWDATRVGAATQVELFERFFQRAGEVEGLGHRSFEEFLRARRWAGGLRRVLQGAEAEAELREARLLGGGGQAAEFLVKLLFAWDDVERARLHAWADATFNDPRQHAVLREAALHLGSVLADGPGIAARDPAALRELRAWQRAHGPVPPLFAARLRAPGAMLARERLGAARFDAAVLPGAELSGAELSGASFFRADLGGARLDGAQAPGALFEQAQLESASLRGAVLTQARFRQARMAGAVLDGADARGAQLLRADLRGAQLRGVDLSQASFRGACLAGADLTDADLRGAELAGADLTGAKLDGAKR
jgi:uncharacterized protein YjbI with pentapeptide repeats